MTIKNWLLELTWGTGQVWACWWALVAPSFERVLEKSYACSSLLYVRICGSLSPDFCLFLAMCGQYASPCMMSYKLRSLGFQLIWCNGMRVKGALVDMKGKVSILLNWWNQCKLRISSSCRKIWTQCSNAWRQLATKQVLRLIARNLAFRGLVCWVRISALIHTAGGSGAVASSTSSPTWNLQTHCFAYFSF